MDMYNGMGVNTIKKLKEKIPEIIKTKEYKSFQDLFDGECNTKYIPVIHENKVNTIIVIGDIHGDYELMKSYFIDSGVAKLRNGELTWCGGNTIIVQVGDQIDRCRPRNKNGKLITCDNPDTMENNDEANDERILEEMTKMHIQALKKGGAVYSLMGNHELMNAMGNMNYASFDGVVKFANAKSDKKEMYKEGLENRKKEYAPGGKYGKFLGCTRLPCIIIGSYIFVHAGIVDGLIGEIGININENSRENLEIIGQGIRLWLLGLLDTSYVKTIIDSTQNSMFWTRLLGSIPKGVKKNDPRCANHISEVLKIFNIDRIIIGHTPKLDSGITGMCVDDSNKPAVIDVDTAASRAFDNIINDHKNNRLIQWLKIENDIMYKCDSSGCTREIS